MDYLPPHDSDSEQAVLACVLLNPSESMAICLESLGEGIDCFYDLRHQCIYRSMTDMYSRGVVIDLPSLIHSLKEYKCLEEVGGIGAMAMLPDVVASTQNLSHHVNELVQKKMLRGMLRICTEYSEASQTANGNTNAVLDGFERDVLAIRCSRPDQTPSILELTKQVITEIEACHQRGGKLQGISTGFPDLDRATGGLHAGEMTVIAGYPGAGKTAFAINIAEQVAVEQKVPVGVFSLEMTAKSLVYRMVLARARVNLRNAKDGELAERDMPRLASATSRISAAPIYLDDASDLSIMQLRSKARRMVQRYGIKLFVIDYLQLLSALGNGRQIENRQQEVTDISRGIKSMAKEFGVPVLALSQLNDDGKLRESRAIGQDADGVWVLEQTEPDKNEPTDARPIDLIIRKQRNGPAPVKINFTFLPGYTRFESAAKVSDEDVPGKYRSPHSNI